MNPFPGAISFFLGLWSVLPWSFKSFIVAAFVFFAITALVHIFSK